MNVLRFACGAESGPFEGSFPGWVRSQIKDLKGYALGHRRKDGRYYETIRLYGGNDRSQFGS